MSFRPVCTFLALATASVAAAESVGVEVRDPQGAALPAVLATLHTRDGRAARHAVTGADGRCLFADLAPGEYLVSVDPPGLLDGATRRVRLDSGGDLELTFDLDLARLREQVVVTAAAVPQLGGELSKSVDVVDRREIDARDELSIPEAVRRAPGVRVQRLGGPGALTSVRLRGMRSEDTALLVDGVRLRDPSGTQGDASGLLSELLVSGVDRIEVLRGSGSSLYGSHAVGGALNVITDPGGGPERGGLLAEGGSLGLLRARGRLTGSAGAQLAYGLGIAHMSTFRGLDGKDEARTSSGQGRVTLRLSPSASLTARLLASGSRTELTESPFAVGGGGAGAVEAVPLPGSELRRYEGGTPLGALELGGATFVENALDPDYERDSRLVSALVRFEQRPAPGLAYEVGYHGLLTDRTFLDGPLGVSGFEPASTTRSELDGRLHTFGARADVSLGAHLLTGGYELEIERFSNRERSSELATTTDVSLASHNAFAQLQLALLEGTLNVAGSVRAQLFELETPTFEPLESSPFRTLPGAAPENALTADASVAWRVGPTTRLRAHLGSGYRAPSLFERFGAFYGSFGYSVYGDPRLSPERSLSADLGVEQSFLGQRLDVSATGFWTRLEDVIVFDFSGAIDPATDPFGRFGGYRNAGGGRSRGVELSLAARPSPGLTLRAAYTYSDAEPPTGATEQTGRAFVIPRHQLSLLATRSLGALDLSLHVDLRSDYLAPLFDPVTFASQTYVFAARARVDLGAGYRLPLAGGRVLRLFAKLDDALDEDRFESGFRTPGRSAFAGAELGF